MFRVSLANAFAHRTLRPLLEKHQATPVAYNLGSALGVGGTEIYSGMVAALDTDGTLKLGTNGVLAYGLFALDANSTINDLDGQPSDLRPFAVWQGGPDAYFRIETPAYNATGISSASVGAFLYADAAGKLALTGQNSATSADAPAAQIVEYVSATRIVIRVLLPTAFDAVVTGP